MTEESAPRVALLECRGKCHDVTVHRVRTAGHAQCTTCGKRRRETTSAMDGCETVAMSAATRKYSSAEYQRGGRTAPKVNFGR